MAAVSRHARCGRHIPHPYGPGGRLCVDQVDCATVTDAERIAWADDLAAIAAAHHDAEVVLRAIPAIGAPDIPADHGGAGYLAQYRRQTDDGLAELAAAFNARRGTTPRDPEPSKHKRAPRKAAPVKRPRLSAVPPTADPAAAPTAEGRPTCPRCGQSFRKPRHGQTGSVGLTWHLENRPSCAADKSRQTAA